MIERIRAIIQHYNMNDRTFSLKCGVKPNTFCNQINGTRGLSLETIYSILTTYENISAEWLIRGKGPMLINDGMGADAKRITSLVDTISMLTQSIKDKDERIRQLELELSTLKNK